MVLPLDRFTRDNVIAYVRALRETNSNATIIQVLGSLRSAIRIMHPGADLSWLTTSGGVSLTSLLPVSRKPIQVIDSKVLYEWGRAMMHDGLLMANPDLRRLEYRNGLLIALFAARAPRVRSMASLRLGVTVIKNGETYRLVFENDVVKTGQRIEYEAPAGLNSAIDRYIAVERTELLSGQNHEWFWVDQYGGPLSARAIRTMIHDRSQRTFGKTFGPHRFRHSMGTTAPLVDPSHPGVAAAILGISARTVETHYNRASHVDVANKFHKSLRKDRAAIQSIARREFRRQDAG
jgi:hypothetical protein